MSDTHHAGRHLAEERGAFEPEAESLPESSTHKATAPLGETAVGHWQDDPERVVAFVRWMQGLSE